LGKNRTALRGGGIAEEGHEPADILNRELASV